jgi:hypothetical protein
MRKREKRKRMREKTYKERKKEGDSMKIINKN